MQLHETPSFLLRVVTVLTFLAAFSESVVPGTMALEYTRTERIRGEAFFQAFDVESIPDPTHGHVEYVGIDEAKQRKLLEVTPEGNFILRADFKETGKRKSFRLSSKKSHRDQIVIVDMVHMPVGCGTWPAFWTVGPGWPNGGEIDIVEGVNGKGPNAATLHTSSGCNMKATEGMTGAQHSFRCAFENGDNAGCGVKFPSPNSFGPAFNEDAGGFYAMLRNKDAIKIWFWPRKGSLPDQIRNIGKEERGAKVDPETWGPPTALFPGDDCNINQFFSPHKLIINLTFCGDWAGATFTGDGCGPSCEDYVNNTPEAFKDAFFDITSIHIYSPPGPENIPA